MAEDTAPSLDDLFAEEMASRQKRCRCVFSRYPPEVQGFLRARVAEYVERGVSPPWGALAATLRRTGLTVDDKNVSYHFVRGHDESR